jgi:threonine dehydratase
MHTFPNPAAIEDAAARLAPYVQLTPVLENQALNARVGCRVLLKAEIFQRTGSFKFRGAMNFLLQLPEDARARGVVAFSSGNHAQGVAAAAAELGLAATIVMPKDAPAAKIAGTRAFGARIVFYDRHSEDREAIAHRIVDQTGATLLRPFDDAKVLAGQGTVGLEFARQAAAAGLVLDHVTVPCSGGGLASGVSLGFRAAGATTAIFAVEPENFDGMGRSLRAAQRVAAPGGPVSIADALMAPMPGVIPFAVAQSGLAGGVAVSDAELARAVAYAVQVLKLVVEPGGAAGLAALLAGRVVGSSAVGVVLSGGNCDPGDLVACCGRWPQP